MNRLRFRLDPVVERGRKLLTSRKISVYVDDLVVWPVASDETARLEIQIDDVLSHLVEAWQPLMLRQTYPLGLQPERPSGMLSQARERWSDMPQDQADEEIELVEHFQDIHDLSRCFGGYYDLPALWLVRSADQMQIEANDRFVLTSFGQANSALVGLGDEISEILGIDSTDRWGDLIDAWQCRDQGDTIDLLHWSTSLEPDAVRRLTEKHLLNPVSTVHQAANDDDELCVAARMASALPESQIEEILKHLKAIPKTSSEKLDTFASKMIAYFDSELTTKKPYDQGELAASHFRSLWGLDEEQSPDLFMIICELGISTVMTKLEPTTLDALAVWGPKHGPAALVNFGSDHHPIPSVDSGQVRVTLAHELCHLLLDSKHSVSAVEVLGGRMPVIAEKRARAFAAELVLPTRLAEKHWLVARRPTDREGLNEIISELCREYSVTKSLASWKLQHAARRNFVNLEGILNSIVPQRRGGTVLG